MNLQKLLALSVVVIGLIVLSFSQLPAEPSFAATLPSATAGFETSLAAPISSTATSLTLASNSVRGGGSVAGYTCFTIDEGTSQAEYACGTVSGTDVSSLTRGISPTTGTTTDSNLQFSHRRGASVKITDFPLLQVLKAQANGEDTFPNIISYSSHPTFDADTQIPDKKYVDDTAFSGASVIDASATSRGVVELATAAEAAASTASGSSGTLALPASIATSTYNSATAGNIIPLTKDTGKIDSNFISTSTLGLTSDVQVFSSSGTWTKPGNAKTVQVVLIGGGGGGGSGSNANSSSIVGKPGAGGAGAGVSFALFNASDLSSSVAITIGTGGLGASAASTTGKAGSATTFGSYLSAKGGNGGNGGAGSATSSSPIFNLLSAVLPSISSAGAGSGGSPIDCYGVPCGGSAGGNGGQFNGSAGSVGNAGGSIASGISLAGGTAGTAGSSNGGTGGNGGNGTSSSYVFPFAGAGGGGAGGGGGVTSGTGGTGGRGGNGGNYGGGGGGGGGGGETGGGSDGAGGNGGNGANGIAVVISSP